MNKEGYSAPILATDLDGTLIPLPDDLHNVRDLRALRRKLVEHQVTLIYVTGRHLRSIRQAITEHELPEPDWIIADVGTTIYARDATGAWNVVEGYATHLEATVAELELTGIRDRLSELSALKMQEAEKQGRFKLSYYCSRQNMAGLVAQMHALLERLQAPCAITQSVDPYSGEGLIDILPRAASKAAALQWWAGAMQRETESIVFAGDSGNDLPALTAGFRSIVVANADPDLVGSVTRSHAAAGWQNRLFVARQSATSGVLQGCDWFGMFDGTIGH